MNIAKIKIDLPSLVSLVFDEKYLKATMSHESGPLKKIMDYCKKEFPNYVKDSNMTRFFRLGKQDDDWVFIFYFEGVRYKFYKDGRLKVTDADADVSHEREEREMMNMIASVLLEDIVLRYRHISKKNGMKCGKAKYVPTPSGEPTRCVIGTIVPFDSSE